MTKTSALKVGSKLEWDCYGDGEPSAVLTVRSTTKGYIIVEWHDKRGQLHIDSWSRRELNRAINIRVLSA